MPEGSDKLLENRRACLLAIGRILRADYEAIAGPIPERLATLVKQFDEVQVSSDPADIESAAPPPAPLPLRLDPDGQSLLLRPHATNLLTL
jgi:hypothetical protein